MIPVLLIQQHLPLNLPFPFPFSVSFSFFENALPSEPIKLKAKESGQSNSSIFANEVRNKNKTKIKKETKIKREIKWKVLYHRGCYHYSLINI